MEKVLNKDIYKEIKEIVSGLGNSLEKRVVIIGSGDYKGEDISEFINLSEYVIRCDFGHSISSQKLGFKTDIMYLDRFNFTPFEKEKIKNNFNNFLHKKCFDDSREIWMPIDQFLINEWFLKTKYPDEMPYVTKKLLEESWDLDDNRQLLFSYLRHLYTHNKLNIKMLDYDEYENLLQSIGIYDTHDRPSPVLYACEMLKIDSRFSEYEWFLVNHQPDQLIDSHDNLPLEGCNYTLSYTYNKNLEKSMLESLIDSKFHYM